MVAEHLEGGGDAVERGDLVLAHQFQDPTGVELRFKHHRGSFEQHRKQAHVQGSHVEQRRNHERYIVAVQVHIHHRVDAVPGDVAVRQERTLGLAGGAGRVEDHGGVVQGDGLIERRRGRSVNHLAIALDAGRQLEERNRQ